MDDWMFPAPSRFGLWGKHIHPFFPSFHQMPHICTSPIPASAAAVINVLWKWVYEGVSTLSEAQILLRLIPSFPVIPFPCAPMISTSSDLVSCSNAPRWQDMAILGQWQGRAHCTFKVIFSLDYCMFDIHSTTYYPFSSTACLRNDDLHHQPPLPIHLPRLQRNGTTTMTTGGSREGGPLCLWFVLFISVTLFLILNILQQKTCHEIATTTLRRLQPRHDKTWRGTQHHPQPLCVGHQRGGNGKGEGWLLVMLFPFTCDEVVIVAYRRRWGGYCPLSCCFLLVQDSFHSMLVALNLLNTYIIYLLSLSDHWL